MNEPVISIIIPCYNSFKDMGKCLDALENQTYKNFEVLIVNDCSTDDSAEQLLAYAESSSLDMHVISNEVNRGPGYSRNVGIEQAKGEWLSFCDADDWYPTDRLQKMLDAVGDADCVLCNYSKVYLNKGEEIDDYISRIKDPTSQSDIVAMAFMSFDTCLIRSSIAKTVPIADLYNGEDYATMPLWLQRCRKIVLTKDSMYSYFMRQGSLSRKPSKTAYLNLQKAFCYMSERSLESYRGAVEFLGIHHVLYGGVLVAMKAGIKRREVKRYIAEFTESYPNWKENPYISTLSGFKRLFLKMVKRRWLFVVKMMSVAHGILIKIR